jgi:hypothetical protein
VAVPRIVGISFACIAEPLTRRAAQKDMNFSSRTSLDLVGVHAAKICEFIRSAPEIRQI